MHVYQYWGGRGKRIRKRAEGSGVPGYSLYIEILRTAWATLGEGRGREEGRKEEKVREEGREEKGGEAQPHAERQLY